MHTFVVSQIESGHIVTVLFFFFLLFLLSLASLERLGEANEQPEDHANNARPPIPQSLRNRLRLHLQQSAKGENAEFDIVDASDLLLVVDQFEPVGQESAGHANFKSLDEVKGGFGVVQDSIDENVGVRDPERGSLNARNEAKSSIDDNLKVLEKSMRNQ